MNTVIFGGTGFVGSHFAKFLLSQALTDKVVLIDLSPLQGFAKTLLKEEVKAGRVVYIPQDVRGVIRSRALPKSADLIADFAAVHREPGHLSEEYHETNTKGAKHICRWAEEVSCKTILFTSSIAVYGYADGSTTEDSAPCPVTPYGVSKLDAEKIYLKWQKSSDGRRAVIVRPGVVFGAGEDGNVSRLVRAVLGRYFFYAGNRQTRKAGVYVKELCHAMWWVLQNQQHFGERISIFNMTVNPVPTLSQYVETVCEVSGRSHRIYSVPFSLLYSIATVVHVLLYPITKVFNYHFPIHPVRIKKLANSNLTIPSYLDKKGYTYLYDLSSAFAEWREESPQDWI